MRELFVAQNDKNKEALKGMMWFLTLLELDDEDDLIQNMYFIAYGNYYNGIYGTNRLDK